MSQSYLDAINYIKEHNISTEECTGELCTLGIAINFCPLDIYEADITSKELDLSDEFLRDCVRGNDIVLPKGLDFELIGTDVVWGVGTLFYYYLPKYGTILTSTGFDLNHPEMD